MPKPSSTLTKTQGSISLRERAERIRDAAGRFIQRIGPADQPQRESLPKDGAVEGARHTFQVALHASQDAARGQPNEPSRNRAAGGRAPPKETDMGRHETFENAIPLVDGLLAGTTLGRPYHHSDPGTELARAVVRYFGNDPIDPVLDGDIKLRDQARALLLAKVVPTKGLLLDADMLALGHELDGAQEAWRRAVEANREPSARHEAFLDGAKKRGRLTMKDHEDASALPGVTEAAYAEDDAFATVVKLSNQALRLNASSIAGLAVQARAVIPSVWMDGA